MFSVDKETGRKVVVMTSKELFEWVRAYATSLNIDLTLAYIIDLEIAKGTFAEIKEVHNEN